MDMAKDSVVFIPTGDDNLKLADSGERRFYETNSVINRREHTPRIKEKA